MELRGRGVRGRKRREEIRGGGWGVEEVGEVGVQSGVEGTSLKET